MNIPLAIAASPGTGTYTIIVINFVILVPLFVVAISVVYLCHKYEL